MAAFEAVLRAFIARARGGDIRIVRVKDRFAEPSAGWH